MRHNAPEDRSINRREWLWVACASGVILLVAVMPNIWGYVNTPADMHFGGLAYNWQDGNSYLAKMAEGARGDWLYTVPFTSDPGEGVWLYPHYLLLGHLSVWLGIENVALFNIARIAASAILLVTLYAFSSRFFMEVRDRRLAFVVAALSTGFGWVAILFGQLYPDLLRAETFPFLATMANPHFPMSMAALIWLLDISIPSETKKMQLNAATWGLYVLGIIILDLMQPYGIAIAGVVLSGWTGIHWIQTRHIARQSVIQAALLIVLGVPYIAYVAWQTKYQPALAGWDQQNITLSPPIWELAASFGLVLLLATPAIYSSLRRRNSNDMLLVSWFFAALVIMYIPYLQQRRFSLGMSIPLGVLATQSLVVLRQRLPIAPFTFVLLTNLSNVVILLLIFSALLKAPAYLYFTQGQWNGLAYLHTQATPHSLVLASPDFGLYIPAWSAQHVIYGHPHETADARARANEVITFFEGKPSSNLPLADSSNHAVRYIFVGPSERLIGMPVIPPSFVPVFAQGDTIIYERQ